MTITAPQNLLDHFRHAAAFHTVVLTRPSAPEVLRRANRSSSRSVYAGPSKRFRLHRTLPPLTGRDKDGRAMPGSAQRPRSPSANAAILAMSQPTPGRALHLGDETYSSEMCRQADIARTEQDAGNPKLVGEERRSSHTARRGRRQAVPVRQAATRCRVSDDRMIGEGRLGSQHAADPLNTVGGD